MNYILLDPPPERFYPFTLTRPLAEMRVFGGTIKEIWEQKLGVKVSHLTRPELSDLYPTKWDKKNLIIRSDWKEFDISPDNRCASSLSLKEKISWSEAWSTKISVNAQESPSDSKGVREIHAGLEHVFP